MPPKKPSKLREQVERQNERSAEEGHERTAEGMKVEPPSRRFFFDVLKKASEPKKS